MDQWTNLVTNAGLGAAVVGALVYFLRHLVTVTLPELTKTFAEQLEKERAAGERRHKETNDRLDRLDQFQGQRHAENLATLKELRHMIRNTDTSVGTFMAVVGDHLGIMGPKRPEVRGQEGKV